jgi:hypothetical protein
MEAPRARRRRPLEVIARRDAIFHAAPSKATIRRRRNTFLNNAEYARGRPYITARIRDIHQSPHLSAPGKGLRIRSHHLARVSEGIEIEDWRRPTPGFRGILPAHVREPANQEPCSLVVFGNFFARETSGFDRNGYHDQ